MMADGTAKAGPDMSGLADDWGKLAALRASAGGTTQPPSEEELAAARRANEREKTKTRRSWYTSVAAADAFQAAVDDIHFATRVPKHLVVAALLEAAVDQATVVEKRLTPRSRRTSRTSEKKAT